MNSAIICKPEVYNVCKEMPFLLFKSDAIGGNQSEVEHVTFSVFYLIEVLI